jgi:hypothetical protein
MKKYKIAVLDDYQNAAIESTDWSALGQGRSVSEANRRDRFDWLGFQEFAFDTAV